MYLDELVPLQQKIVSASTMYNNIMGLGVYALLGKKQQELKTKIEYTEALKDYWITKVRLHRAVGGIIPT
jgi:hypothetical protein